MFISEHQRKTNVCRFCSLITQMNFFRNFWSLVNCMCIPFPEPWEFEKDLRFTFYLSILVLKVERTFKKRAKTAERNSSTCEWIFHQLAVKNVNVNVVIKIYCKRNSIFLRQKKLWSSLFDRPDSGFVWAKKYLAGHHDRRPAVHYSQLSPCGHPAITDTPIKRTAAKSQAKINYRRLTEINSPYYGLSLIRTLTRGPYSVRNKGSSWLYFKPCAVFCTNLCTLPLN